MKTSLFNGINTAKLDFNYNIRYRPRVNVSELGMNRQIQYLFRGINYEYICYVWENDKNSKLKHSHNLVKSDDEGIINKLGENILSKNEPIKKIDPILIQKPKTLLNPKNGEKIQIIQDVWEEVERITLIGKHGEVHIEKVLSNQASSIYNHKFTDYGVNFGYINPYLSY